MEQDNKPQIEYDFAPMPHFDMAKKIRGQKSGYIVICTEADTIVKVYEKSLNYFDRFKTKIGKLFYNINTDTVSFFQYGFPSIEKNVGIYKVVLDELREKDLLIIKGRTSSKIQYRHKVSEILKEKGNFLSDSKYIYVPERFLRRWK